MLKVIEQARSESLRARMDAAGCVFQFVALQTDSALEADETLRRQAQHHLHNRLLEHTLAWHSQLLKNPQNADLPEPEIDWATECAIARLVPTSELTALEASLYGAFRRPPYNTKFAGGEQEAMEVFQEWIELLGLIEADQPQVIDWVSNLAMDYENGKEPWSHYFDEGLEWWGVWCLTIWNPRSRTLSALIASTTD